MATARPAAPNPQSAALAAQAERARRLAARTAFFLGGRCVEVAATEELFNRVKALLDRREMAARTGLHGESEAVREVLESIGPVLSKYPEFRERKIIERIAELVQQHFDLRPKGIVRMLDLLRR